jgi:hypothetical protein
MAEQLESPLRFGELGTATIVDAFGLSAPLSAGGQAMLTAGSGYALRNTGTGPVTLLRLSLGSQALPDPVAQVLLESQLPTLPATRPRSYWLSLSGSRAPIPAPTRPSARLDSSSTPAR